MFQILLPEQQNIELVDLVKHHIAVWLVHKCLMMQCVCTQVAGILNCLWTWRCPQIMNWCTAAYLWTITYCRHTVGSSYPVLIRFKYLIQPDVWILPFSTDKSGDVVKFSGSGAFEELDNFLLYWLYSVTQYCKMVTSFALSSKK